MTETALFLKIIIYLFLAALGLSCWHAGSLLRHVGSFIAPCMQASLQLWRVGFLFSSCDMQAPGRVGSVVVVLGLQSAWALQFAACGLSSGGTQVQQLWRAGLVAPRHVGSQFPDQGSNPHPLHCKADSLPLDHQGSPCTTYLTKKIRV